MIHCGESRGFAGFVDLHLSSKSDWDCADLANCLCQCRTCSIRTCTALLRLQRLKDCGYLYDTTMHACCVSLQGSTEKECIVVHSSKTTNKFCLLQLTRVSSSALQLNFFLLIFKRAFIAYIGYSPTCLDEFPSWNAFKQVGEYPTQDQLETRPSRWGGIPYVGQAGNASEQVGGNTLRRLGWKRVRAGGGEYPRLGWKRVRAGGGTPYVGQAGNASEQVGGIPYIGYKSSLKVEVIQLYSGARDPGELQQAEFVWGQN